MRTIGCTLCLAVSLLSVAPAVSQPAGGSRVGGGGGGGERGGDSGSGAYASPSGIPDAPTDEKFGIPQIGRRSIEALTLPERPVTSLPPFALPALPEFNMPQMLPSLEARHPEKGLVLNAQLEEGGSLIPDGLVWRLFAPEPTAEGRLQLVAVSKGGQAIFDVPQGPYLLHVGYGRAGMARTIDYSTRESNQVVRIDAGGLRLGASDTGGQPIKSALLTFDIYGEEESSGERRLIAEKVPADVVVRLNSGAYHVVSNYGSVNAVVQADVAVETGRITDALVKHRAAELTLKLVRETGGEALADTAWSIASAQGDVVKESVGAFSNVVLEEGDYVIVAENRDRLFQEELTVVAGQSAEIEILANEIATPADAGSGD